MIDYEEKIRPALADFVWPEQNESSRKAFDPIQNAADAWGLQAALVTWGWFVSLHRFDLRPAAPYTAKLYKGDTVGATYWGEGETPAQALIAAYWQAFGER